MTTTKTNLDILRFVTNRAPKVLAEDWGIHLNTVYLMCGGKLEPRDSIKELIRLEALWALTEPEAKATAQDKLDRLATILGDK